MAISAEWIKNKHKQRIYAISHAKAVVRGNSTVDADLSKMGEDLQALDQKIEDKKAGLIEIEYAAWNALSEEERAAMGDVLVLNYPMDFTLGNMREMVTSMTQDIQLLDDSVGKLEGDCKVLSYNNAGIHNSIYRGKNLGDHVTDEQWAAINAGTFKDLFIGDYWIINGVTYRIAAFDYWLNCGDTACTTHHVVIVPDTGLYTAQMNTSNTTSGGYIGSAMYKTGLNSAKTTIQAAFGASHILSHRELLTNATSNGMASAGAWVDSTVELMNERMVYGGTCFTPVSNGSTVPYSYTIDKGQLPLFALEPSRICNRQVWWLRDVITSAHFAGVHFGYSYYNGASGSYSVRPAVGIC